VAGRGVWRGSRGCSTWTSGTRCCRRRAIRSSGWPWWVDFELFRGELEAALDRSDRAKGGRPPYDPVLMFKVLVLQTLYPLSDDQTEYQIRDRLSFRRFAGMALEDRVPDVNRHGIGTLDWLAIGTHLRVGAWA
jgi:hypothetical protein